MKWKSVLVLMHIQHCRIDFCFYHIQVISNDLFLCPIKNLVYKDYSYFCCLVADITRQYDNHPITASQMRNLIPR